MLGKSQASTFESLQRSRNIRTIRPILAHESLVNRGHDIRRVAVSSLPQGADHAGTASHQQRPSQTIDPIAIDHILAQRIASAEYDEFAVELQP